MQLPGNSRASSKQDRVSRRDFLRVGAVGTVAAVAAGGAVDLSASSPTADRSCILINLVGGPSQLDTFDPKPNAPVDVRGPFQPIRTAVPGVLFSEHLPLLAARAGTFSLVRTVNHSAAPIHETGQQLIQTGRVFTNGQEFPHLGAVLSDRVGARRGAPTAFAVVPRLIEDTGVSVSHGQSAAYLGRSHSPTILGHSSDHGDHSRFGTTPFGRSLLQARRLVERGVRCVTVNMFTTVFNNITWDCHADGGSLAASLTDYAQTLCPMLDQGLAALLDDLRERGLLTQTLVVAVGEFGRTPVLNPRGGRDHWTGCWTALLAGGGVQGGLVVGQSDAWAGEPKDRAVSPAEITATIYQSLGVDPRSVMPGPDGAAIPLVEASPITELF